MKYLYIFFIYQFKILNMLLTPQHRRSTRRRRTPKRYEDEKFVSGSIDRYQYHYNGRFKEGHYIANRQDDENHFQCNRNDLKRLPTWLVYGGKQDFAESLLEFTSIWRDFDRILPGALVEKIGSYLELRPADRGVLMKDDEFIVADENEEKVKEISDSDEEEFDDNQSDTDEDEYWSEYSDNDCDSEYD